MKMVSKECAQSNIYRKGCFVDVPIDSEFPKGWKKKVYEINGKQFPKWSIWFDEKGIKFTNEKRAKDKILFNCLEFDKQYKEKLQLEKHQNILSILNLHVCDICEKRFAQTSDLLEHRMEIHSEEVKSINVGEIVLSKLEELNSEFEQNMEPIVKQEPECKEYFEDKTPRRREQKAWKLFPPLSKMNCIQC